MRASRRAFVVGGVAAVGAAGAFSLNVLGTSEEDAIASLIRASFPGEDIAANDVAVFARTAASTHGPFSRGQVAAMESPLVRGTTSWLSDKDVQTIPGRIIADFVRSSDILDPERTGPCTYLIYAAPYEIGCSNPLPTYSGAQLEWPATVYD